MFAKRYIYRNRPYRKKGILKLGLADGSSSFPTTNLLVSVSAPYSIMRLQNGSFLVDSVDILRCAKYSSLWVIPYSLSQIHLGSIHLSDALFTIFLVKSFQQGCIGNYSFDFLRSFELIKRLTTYGDGYKAYSELI